jgi:3-hydroxyisobutyrate dehydrogenase
MKIGICGLGGMGSGMAHKLLDDEYDLTVWNRTPARAEPLTERGAALALNPAALAAACDIIIVMVLDDDACAAVYEGDEGLVSADLSDKLVIEMSTVSPATGKRLAELVKARSGGFVDCPVGGSVGPAREGKLLGVAGGTAEDFARAEPVLDRLTRRLEHVGPNGAGCAMKLAVNLPLQVYWEALGEALSLADAAGIDIAQAGSILEDTSGTIKVAPMRIPWIVETLGGRIHEDVGFSVDGMAKDLRLMCDFAAENGFEVPACAAAKAGFDGAAADGWGQRDGALTAAWRAMQARK